MTFNDIKHILSTKRVGIAGCGGIGSNAAISLARSYVGNIILADFDIVDYSNLNRQYFFEDQIGLSKVDALKSNILKINPQINVIAHNIKIFEDNIFSLFNTCDVVIEAFDLEEMKSLIISTMSAQLPNIPLIIANGIAGYGNNNIISELKYDNLIVCGDHTSSISSDNPPLAPKVAIIANMQANACLEILLNNKLIL